jgi:glycosyltransferase involved in cell wall biosynthesis/ribosomal protein S18 acetylase RimI-like enzyme
MLNSNHSRPVRILHVVGESRYGGVAIVIMGLARMARAEGWQVDILTNDRIFQQAVEQDGFGLVDLDVIRREIRPLWDIRGLVRLVKYLRRERYDIVHTHTSKGGFIGRLAAHLAGVPLIVHTMHGLAFHEGSPASVRMIYSALERMASSWCDRIVAVSGFHRDWAIRLGICDARRIVAIPNGIAAPHRNPEIDVAQLRRSLAILPGDVLALTVSRLAEDKGLRYLLHAAAMLPRGRSRIRIVIAGDGPARPELERLAVTLGVGSRVSFIGFRHDIGDLLAACDMVVLPSIREGLSISLLEAMAAGKPIVATGIGSQREVASHGEMACLVPPADAVGLCRSIMRLADDPAARRRLGANARAVYRSHYTEARMLKSYRNLYLNLLGIHDSRPASEHDYSIRPATPADLPAIVDIHRESFRNFFLTRLGPDFLLRYYRLVLSYPAGIVLVSGHPTSIAGFACGFVDPATFYRLMWRTRLAFAAPVLSSLVRHPSLVTKVIDGVRRIQAPPVEWPPRSCELSSIAVAPEHSGNGFGKALIAAFLAHAQSMDARRIYLTTDAEGNDAANDFYRSAGFQQTRRFVQGEGRWMNEYMIDRSELRP